MFLTVHLQPGARRTEIVGPHGDALRIRVSAPPAGGAANAALVELLAGILGVPRRDIRIAAGRTARRKRLEIWGDEEVGRKVRQLRERGK